jgi:ribosomal protein L37E
MTLNIWGKRSMPRDWSRKPKWKQILDAEENSEKKLKNNGGRKSLNKKNIPRLKLCNRCGNSYYTMSKYSKYCDACKLPSGKYNSVYTYKEVNKDGSRKYN